MAKAKRMSMTEDEIARTVGLTRQRLRIGPGQTIPVAEVIRDLVNDAVLLDVQRAQQAKQAQAGDDQAIRRQR